MKKIGIYGGTFNPVHIGHIRAAEAFYDAIGLDELIVMPTFISPHKEMMKGDDPAYRLEMTALAFEGNKRNITVSDYEISKGGKSYTYLTLEHFSSSDTELYFLMGTDMLLCLERWKNPERILELSTIVLVRRENESETEEQIKSAIKRLNEQYGARIIQVAVDPIELSSREIREYISEGDSVYGLVPERVEGYISSYRLYHSYPLYESVRELVPKKRLKHIFGTEEEALRLALIFELSPEEAEKLRIAALLHDITKYYTAEEHVKYLEGMGVKIDPDTLKSEKTLHQLSGAYRAKELFSDLVDETVFNAIRYHTTGRENMSLTEKLMYLADYIEPNRTFPDCVTLRDYFYKKINDGEDRNAVLIDTMIRSLEMTIADLAQSSHAVHSDTLKALDFLKGEK